MTACSRSASSVTATPNEREQMICWRGGGISDRKSVGEGKRVRGCALPIWRGGGGGVGDARLFQVCRQRARHAERTRADDLLAGRSDLVQSYAGFAIQLRHDAFHDHADLGADALGSAVFQ